MFRSNSAKPRVYDSTRRRLKMLEDVGELIRYRDLLVSLVRRDLTVRYKRSVLGFLWTMLNPLLVMLVMTVVFSNLFRFDIECFPVYVLAGLLLYNFFSQSTTHAMHNIVWGGGLLNKIYVPKAIFVVSVICVGLVNLLLALIPLALIMLATGHAFSPALLFLPAALLLTLLFALGVGLAVAALAVFFVDLVDIYQVGLTILLYLTPLFYPVKVVPSQYLFLIHLNPMYYFVEIFRQPIYLGTLPETDILMRATLLAVIALGVGWGFFARKADEFAYHV
jgi:ABC-2 type transport system permease protein